MGQYPVWYRAVRDMARKVNLHTKQARDVFRRAGVRQGGGESFSSPVLSLPGTRRVCLDPVDVFVGETATFATYADGTLYAWGSQEQQRSWGPLYTGEGSASYATPQVMNDPGMQNAGVQVSGVSQSKGGTLFMREGDTTLRHPSTSVAEPWAALELDPPASFTDIIQVESYFFTPSAAQFLLRSGGEVWRRGRPLPGTNSVTVFAWGAYSELQMGGLVVEIATGDGRLSWRLDDERIFTWGNTEAGATDGDIHEIEDVPSGVVKMAHGGSHLAVLTDSGEIWTAGSDQYGEGAIGTDPLPDVSTSNDYAAFRQAVGSDWEDVACGPFQTFAVKDGSFYSCGGGADDPSTLGNTPQGGRGPASHHIGTLTEVTDPDPGDVTKVFANHTGRVACYATEGGCLYTWGQTVDGSTGQGAFSSPDFYRPVSVKVSEGYPAFSVGP